MDRIGSRSDERQTHGFSRRSPTEDGVLISVLFQKSQGVYGSFSSVRSDCHHWDVITLKIITTCKNMLQTAQAIVDFHGKKL
jgi:hypothetical protein